MSSELLSPETISEINLALLRGGIEHRVEQYIAEECGGYVLGCVMDEVLRRSGHHGTGTEL